MMVTVPETDRTWRRILVGIVLASLGAALFYGSLTPRDFGPDEPAHTAYAVVLEEGHLPDVDTIKPERRAELRSGRAPNSTDYVYVANHPPLFAAVQAGVSKVLDRTGLAHSPELAVGRALNALCTLLSVVAVGSLGRAVGGSRRIGVLAAGMFAAVPALWSLATYGYSDGGSVLATALVVWAGVEAWKRFDRTTGAWLALAVVGAGATRATALIVALAVTAAVCLRHGFRSHHGPGPSATVATRSAGPLAGLGRTAVSFGLVVIPAVVLTGWWYLRNWIRFGDPTASHLLNERLGRAEPSGGIPARLADLDMWRRMLSELAASTYSPTLGPAQPRFASVAVGFIGLVALASLVGLALLAARGLDLVPHDPDVDSPTASHPDPSAALRVDGWPVLVVALGAVLFGIAGHTSTGGTAHARYLLLGLPSIVVLVVVGLGRLHRWIPVIATGALAAGSLAMIVMSTHWIDAIDRSHHLQAFGADGWRVAGVVLLGGGLLGVVAAALAGPEPMEPTA